MGEAFPASSPCAGECPGRLSWSNVFSRRIVLQNPRQGTPCVSAGGCRASIERRRPATPGRMQLPLVISQQVASPRGEVPKYGIACQFRRSVQDEPEVLFQKPLLNTPGTFSGKAIWGRTDLPVRPRQTIRIPHLLCHPNLLQEQPQTAPYQSGAGTGCHG